MNSSHFELRVIPRPASEYGLALYQTPARTNSHAPESQLVAQVWGAPLRMVADNVFRALRKGGHRMTELTRSREKPFDLDEDTGVRLGVLFLAVKPLHKPLRIDAISSAVQSMASEEAYYWFSKCTAARTAPQAQKALRILLAKE
jgi:hypothetical protein